MAKKQAGDYRDWSQIEAWSREVAAALVGPRAPQPTPVPLPSRALALGLTLFVGTTAIAGGIELMVLPRGWGAVPITLLEHAPFGDFFVPGLLLLTLVGLPAAYAAWRHAVRDPYAPFASMLAGVLLAVWMLVEMAMLRTAHPLELFYLSIGVVTIADARRRMRPMLDEFREQTRAKSSETAPTS